MNIVFIGSGELGRPALKALVEGDSDDVVAVVSQPDRPAGRRRHLTACPLKQQAQELGLPLMTPLDINSTDSLREIAALDADIFIVASYGQFLGAKLLEIPKKAAINIHPSLLPRYRGASPIQWAIINGDDITGVTILYVDRRMDAGDIIAQRQCGISPDDTTASLKTRLARIGAEMTMEVLGDFRRGAVQSRPQDERAVVMAPKFAKEDGRIDFTQAAELIARRVRGLQPWPGSFFEDSARQRVRLLRVVAEEGGGRVGEIIDVGADGPLIATGLGALRLLEVQPAGKRGMSGSDYANGQHLQVGEALVAAAGVSPHCRNP